MNCCDLPDMAVNMSAPESAIADVSVRDLLKDGVSAIVVPAISRVDMAHAAIDRGDVPVMPGRRAEQAGTVGNMLKLIIRGKKRRRHAAPDFLELRRADKAGRIAVKSFDVRHKGRYGVFLVPGCPAVIDAAAAVPDIFQFHVLDFGCLSFGPARPVPDVDYVVRKNPVRMFTGYTG